MSNFVSSLSSLIVIATAAAILFVLLKAGNNHTPQNKPETVSRNSNFFNKGYASVYDADETVGMDARAFGPIMTVEQLTQNPRTKKHIVTASFPIFDIENDVYISRPSGTPGKNVILLSTNDKNSKTVSDGHLRIFEKAPGIYYGEDEGSKNRTRILKHWGEPLNLSRQNLDFVSKFPIKDNTVVMLGSQAIRFRLHDHADHSFRDTWNSQETIRYEMS